MRLSACFSAKEGRSDEENVNPKTTERLQRNEMFKSGVFVGLLSKWEPILSWHFLHFSVLLLLSTGGRVSEK